MSSALPPLAAIRVFEAAARLSSFTKAAEELGMTQAAVSYQIKLLEERVGGPLFIRRPRQVELTEAGRRLAPNISEAFRLMSEAYRAVQGGAGNQLNITATQTFASSWLSRRLGSFQVSNPSLAVRLDTSMRLVDFSREDMDVGIRVGKGVYPGLAAHFLFDGDFSAMLSPKLAESIGGVKRPADLLKLPLLGPDDYWWEKWFTVAGVPYNSTQIRPGTTLGAQTYEANAAMAGQGVALLTRHLYRQDIAEGRLIQPFDIVGSDDDAYWLVYAEYRRNVPKIRAFRDWLLDEARKN
jgi:LysR family glycine cleavage system transcriptional activator